MIQLRPHQERGVAAMAKHSKGQLIVPTGAGKTLKMIYDCLRELQSETPQTIVVVAPRILLAEQLSSEFLEFITNAEVLHVHSGETHHEQLPNLKTLLFTLVHVLLLVSINSSSLLTTL
jgi:superfamily II DNA or RNA helicase